MYLFSLLKAGQEGSDISILLKDIEAANNDIKLASRKIKRRTPQEGSTQPLSFGKEVRKNKLIKIKYFKLH